MHSCSLWENHRDLIKQCSSQTAGTTSQQRSTLPVTGKGHDLSSGLRVQVHEVLTCRRPPGMSMPGRRRLPDSCTCRMWDTSCGTCLVFSYSPDSLPESHHVHIPPP